MNDASVGFASFGVASLGGMARGLAFVAGLFGAAGLILAALASHGGIGSNGAMTATLVMIHAPALLAISLGVMGGHLSRLGLWAGIGMALGIALFAGDVTLRGVIGRGLFPMAAPSGAMLAIGCWLLGGFRPLAKRQSGPEFRNLAQSSLQEPKKIS